jgi:hypothetical protein
MCSIFAVADAVTTWYGIRVLHVPEQNPAARWGIAHIGLTGTLTLRVVVGCAVVGVAALGATARLPRQPPFVIRACSNLLIFAAVFWGAVAVNNVAQII